MKVYLVDAGYIEYDPIDGTLVSEQEWVCGIFDSEEKAVNHVIQYANSRLNAGNDIDREEFFVRPLTTSLVVPDKDIWYAITEPVDDSGYWIRYREYDLQ